MAHTLKCEVDEDVQAWLVFIDRRQVIDFNSDLKSALMFEPGMHRLAIDLRGSGSTIKIWIEGVELNKPEGGWPLVLTVPNNEASAGIVAEFTL